MQVAVNLENAKNHSKKINSIAECFTYKSLTSADDKTTISANKALKEAYSKSQYVFNDFGEKLALDAEHIKSIGIAFKQIDELHTELVKKHSMGPTITSAN